MLTASTLLTAYEGVVHNLSTALQHDTHILFTPCPQQPHLPQAASPIAQIAPTLGFYLAKTSAPSRPWLDLPKLLSRYRAGFIHSWKIIHRQFTGRVNSGVLLEKAHT